jgi:uncharacterized protein YndB with AHSA1/START domain
MDLEIDTEYAAHPTSARTTASTVHCRINQAPSTIPPNGREREFGNLHRRATIRIRKRYEAPAGCIFGAWLDPEVAGRWLFATASQPMTQVDIDARVGGSFRFANWQGGETAEFTGRYIEIVPARRLVFTLSIATLPRAQTRVTVMIAPVKKGCALDLIHENVPRDCASYLEGRWTGILYGLGVTLDPAAGTFHHDQE